MGISMATAHPNVGGHTRTAFWNPEGWIHLAWLSLVQTHMCPFTGLLSYSFCECLWSVPKRGSQILHHSPTHPS